MKTKLLALTILSLAAASPALAQTEPAATASASAPVVTRQLAVDGDVSLPIGDSSDGIGLGVGALIRFEQVVAPRLAVTGRAGFIYHLPKDVGGVDIKFWTIPALAGVKYFVNDNFYAAGELGIFYSHASAAGLSSSETNLGLTLGGGYHIGALDLRAGLHFMDLGNASESMALAINVGFSFWGQ